MNVSIHSSQVTRFSLFMSLSIEPGTHEQKTVFDAFIPQLNLLNSCVFSGIVMSKER